MRQLTMRVKDEIAGAFYQFCDRQQVRPYELLGSIVDFYGRAELLTQKVERKELSRSETLIELGHIVADMKSLAKANGEFKKAIADILESHGVKIEELNLI